MRGDYVSGENGYIAAHRGLMRKLHSWKKCAYKEQHAQVAQEGHGLEESCLPEGR